jgi:hypothetical protein
MVVLAFHTGIGISLSSSIEDQCLSIANEKARVFYKDAISENKLFGNPITGTLTLYVRKLSESPLPPNLHISRDEPNADHPRGHHTINSLLGDRTGSDFVNRLHGLSFAESWYMELSYDLTYLKQNIWVYDRKIRQGMELKEDLEDELKWAGILFQ